MVWLAEIPNVTGRCNTAIAEKAVYACPRYRSVYGTISVTEAAHGCTKTPTTFLSFSVLRSVGEFGVFNLGCIP